MFKPSLCTRRTVDVAENGPRPTTSARQSSARDTQILYIVYRPGWATSGLSKPIILLVHAGTRGKPSQHLASSKSIRPPATADIYIFRHFRLVYYITHPLRYSRAMHGEHFQHVPSSCVKYVPCCIKTIARFAFRRPIMITR